MKDKLKEIRLKDWLWGEYDKWYLANGDKDTKSTETVELFLSFLLGGTFYTKEEHLIKGFREYCQPSPYNNFKLVFPESECFKVIKNTMK